MKKILTIFIIFVLAQNINANNIKVENVKYNKTNNEVSFKISWENAWRQTEDFHDAAWVFCKYKTVNVGRWLHTDIKPNSTTTSGVLETKETSDKLGFFVRFNTDSVGKIAPTEVSFIAENIIGIFPDFEVFAIEMVYVPEGPFYAGAPEGVTYLDYGDIAVFYQRNYLSNFQKNIPLIIGSEDEIKTTSGRVVSDEISSAIPKGYAAFYCMKHEISNEQLIHFFNNAGFTWVSNLGLININPTQYKYKNNYLINPGNSDTINIIGNLTANGIVFSCDNKLLNYPALITPLTLTNYLGWAGLAPMTELQYEKACRGPLYPVKEEIAAGVSSYESTLVNDTAFKNLFNENEALKKQVSAPTANEFRRVGFAADSLTNRLSSNATFYGILNMCDNALEITVNLRHADTNALFNGNSKKTESFLNPSLIGFNSYMPRPIGESDGYTNVIYKRGDETSDYNYDSYNFNNTFSLRSGGRGVRKPN